MIDTDDTLLVEYQESPKAPRETWAYVPMDLAEEYAKGLLESFWDQDLSMAAVYVDGKRLRVRKPNGWTLPKSEILEVCKALTGSWIVRHKPTDKIIAGVKSKYDATFIMEEVKKVAGKGIESSDPKKVISSLPERFSDYLFHREFAETYEHFVERTDA